MKKLKVTVNGKVYEVLVEIEGEETAAAAPAVPAAPAAPAPVKSAPVSAPAPSPAPAPKPAPAPAAAGSVLAPLAGKVVSVDVKVGDSVKEGDQVLTLEAMKMNTYIYADRAGKIAAVNVAVGDGVEEGQALVTIA